MPGIKGFVTNERRLEELNLPTLEYRQQRFDMIILYKMLNNKLDFDYKNV